MLVTNIADRGCIQVYAQNMGISMELEKEIEKAHGENGDCASCGYWPSFYECNYDKTGEIIDNQIEWYRYCSREPSCRGAYVYTNKRG